MLTVNVNVNVTVIGQPRGNGHFHWRRDSARPFTLTFTVNILQFGNSPFIIGFPLNINLFPFATLFGLSNVFEKPF